MQTRTLEVCLGMLLATHTLHGVAVDTDYGMDKNGPMTMGQGVSTQASVVISAPMDGAVLPANQPIKVTYQAVPGPKSNHVHAYVDGELVAILRQLSGDYEIKNLNPGKHKISIAIVTKDYQLIGTGKQITVEVR